MGKISRRSFIKGSLAAAGALSVSAAPLPASAKGIGPGELATMLDIGKCIGCGACVEACRDSNEHKFPEPDKPFPKMYPPRVKTADWSDKRDIDDRLTPYNWLFIQYADVEINGEQTTITVPRRCMHCTNPPCADLCPFGAARKLKNGITRIHPDICLGGAKCKLVCPWDIPERQTGVGPYLQVLPNFAGNGVMFKCDRCYDLIEQGELPACIEACPEDVQTIGPRDEIIAAAYARAEEINGYVYGDKENGGTNTIYVSPVPFDVLNEALEKGPGMPHMAPVPDSMAHADTLAKAMILAPIAGLAAGFIKFTGGAKPSSQSNKEES
ncbi:4Fe-4S dicluster domain-containing protein [Desulfatibacillum aliphaticivorans]|uniref:4Fe-4S dicluster domain-containing protein n=1 Tax=Desulfatibacillum aliphaticivorans TaxID=218208 RepID=UPI00041C7384|nr:4Fe-4S dicluster domain-containing protein [Desulfatibacillum aliphaticivorans]